MPRKTKEKIAVQPAEGKKITFGEGEEYEDVADAGPSRWRPMRREEEEDSDDAPEAVEQSTARQRIQQDSERIADFDKKRREAKAARSKALKAQKAAKDEEAATKRAKDRPNAPGSRKRRAGHAGDSDSGDEAESEDKRLQRRMEAAMDDADGESESESEELEESPEERRLRRRMEAAMAQADEESEEDEASAEDGEELEDDGLEDEDDEEASFHTASEDADSDEEEDDDDDDDDSEILEDGPLDAKTIAMRAKMQAMMEAAERRALGPTSSSTKPPKSALKKAAEAPLSREVIDDDADFDLTPYATSAQPLSAKAIKAAARAEREAKERATALELEKKRRRAAEDKRERKEAARKKARREQDGMSTKQISENKALLVLPPVLQNSGGLPPILDASQRVRGVNKIQKKFMKTAMRSSGTMTAKGWKSGRKSTRPSVS